MKQFFLFLCGIFISVVCFAETVTLDWYKDGQLYDQTTCTVGASVTLPTPPTKFGYDFDGWSEIFDRGTFANWASVPTDTSSYSKDAYDSRTPKENDYIIVTNASDFGNTAYLGSDGTTLYWNVEGVKGNALIANISSSARYVGERNSLGFRNAGSNIYIYVGEANHYKTSPSGTSYLSTGGYTNYSPITRIVNYTLYTDPTGYSGTWRFKYTGTWLTDGKAGWVPERQLN